MERLQRLRHVRDVYDAVEPVPLGESSEISDSELLEYIASIKGYLSRLHVELVHLLEQA
ncbi:MAG: hypothetical protein ACFFED_11915 [Candidatus Thorarchaeota archaeon]